MKTKVNNRNIEHQNITDTKAVNTMRSAVQYAYGPPEVLSIETGPIPSPGDDDILIRVHSTTVTGTESIFRQGKPYFSRLFTGLTKPKNKTLGEEMAGEVVAIGKNVSRFQVGDHIFGTAGAEFGAAAEYLAVSQDEALSHLPGDISHAEAAASVDGFLTALPFLRDSGNIHSGQKVLIYGASGSVGSAAVQIANYYNAEVTAVCSGRNADLVKSIGADEVIDYGSDDFPKKLGRYDIIFDAVGKISFHRFKKNLVPNGIFLEAGMNLAVIFHVLLSSIIGGKKAKIAATGLRPAAEKNIDLYLLKQLMEEGKIVPTIDRSYALKNIQEAHRYVDTGRKRGNVVIDVIDS